MKLSLQKMKALVPDGRLDENIFKSIELAVKSHPVFDTDQIQEQAIRDLAVEVMTEYPEVKATVEDEARERNVQEGAARFAWWCNVGKNGRRLARIKFNQNRVVQWLEQNDARTGEGLSATTVDKAISALENALQWEQVSAPAPAPAPVAPPPKKRLLASGEEELDLDASESEMRRASKEQLQDLSRRRGEGASHRKAAFAFQPMPPEVTRKVLLNCSREELERYRQRHGDQQIDARLQGRG